MANRPPATTGMRHVALFVEPLGACEDFYVQLLGMQVEWRPDADNLFLTSGNDNLALHRTSVPVVDTPGQRLDHIGFILAKIEHVDLWHTFFVAAEITIVAAPRTHRDGARSFYCLDPAGTRVQMIWHPPLAD